MNTNDGGLLLTIADKLGVSALLILLAVLGVWRSAPRLAAFLSSITEENKAMTRALSGLSQATGEHHVVTMDKLDSLRGHVDSQMVVMEERLKAHTGVVVGEMIAGLRNSAEVTGRHAAIDAMFLTEQMGRSPSVPELGEEDRPSPTPAGFTRQLPHERMRRPPSQPGAAPPSGTGRLPKAKP